MEDRVDEAGAVAILVHHRDVDRVLVLSCRIGRRGLEMLRELAVAQLAGQLLRQQIVDVHIGKARIGQQRIPHPVGHARGIDLGLQPLGRERVRARLQALQNVQQQQGNDALARRRALVHHMVSEPALDRLHELATIGGEVLKRVHATEAAQIGDDVLRDLSLVEAGAALLGDFAQGGAQLRLAVNRSDGRCLAIDQHDVARGGGGQQLRVHGPVGAGARRHGIALLGEADGIFQKAAHGQPAEPLRQGDPGVHGARHRDHVGRLAAQLLFLARGKNGLQGGGLGRPAGAVVGRDPVGALLAVQRKAVSSNAGGARLHHALDRTGRDGGIHGGAAVLQDANSGLGGGRVRGCRHAVRGHDDGTARILEITHNSFSSLCCWDLDFGQ